MPITKLTLTVLGMVRIAILDMLNYFSAINPTHDYKQKPATLVLEAIDSISIKAFACSTVLVKP